jgi:hypothetical protein
MVTPITEEQAMGRMTAPRRITNEYSIGMRVFSDDAEYGELDLLVLDPDSRSITHLVVQPVHGYGRARLVPIGLADIDGNDIRLRCTLEAWQELPYAREVEFIAPFEPWMEPFDEAVFWPGPFATPRAIVCEHLPEGEIEVRDGEHLHAVDGPIGHIEGVGVDPVDRHVVCVLLREGHLRSRKKVEVPFGDAARICDDGVHVALTRRAIRDLPEIPRHS